MSLRTWQLNEPKSCSVVPSLTSSPTPVPKLIRECSRPFSNPAVRLWDEPGFWRPSYPWAAPNQSGKWFEAVQYGVSPRDNRIDYDQVEALARVHVPKLIIAGGSAIPRVIDFEHMRAIADEIGAYLMVDMAHFAGLVAAGEHPSPFPHAHVVTTTTHKTLRGPRGGMILTNDESIAKKVNSAIFPGIQGGPLMHVIAAKAVAFGEALRPDFKNTYVKCA